MAEENIFVRQMILFHQKSLLMQRLFCCVICSPSPNKAQRKNFFINVFAKTHSKILLVAKFLRKAQ